MGRGWNNFLLGLIMYSSMSCATHSFDDHNVKRYSIDRGNGYLRTYQSNKPGEYLIWDPGLKLFIAREKDIDLDGKIDEIEIYFNGIHGDLLKKLIDKDGDGVFETIFRYKPKK